MYGKWDNRSAQILWKAFHVRATMAAAVGCADNKAVGSSVLPGSSCSFQKSTRTDVKHKGD